MFWLRTPCGASDGERLADAAAVRRGRSGRRRMSEVSRRRRSSRSRFDAAGHQGPASNLRGNPSRSRTRADSASLATAEAMAALIAYAAAPRSWAATWATATACPAARAANFAGSGSPRAAAFATKAARCASRMRTSPRPVGRVRLCRAGGQRRRLRRAVINQERESKTTPCSAR